MSFIYSCNNSKKQDKTSPFDVINVIDKSTISESDFLAGLTNISYIPLRGDSSNLIAEISKTIHFNNRFYILDRKQSNIKIFDDNGALKQVISKIGSGPGEYISLDGFDINKSKKTLVVYSLESRKLITYSLEGKFIEETKVSFFGYDFLYDDFSGKNLFFINNNPDRNIQNYNLLFTDNKYKVEKRYFPFELNTISIAFAGGITQGFESIIYNTPLSDTIFSCNINGVTPKYFVDFKQYKTPLEIKNGKRDFSELLNYSYIENLIYESKNMLIFPYIHKRRPYITYYNKETKKIINNKELSNTPFYILPSPIGAEGDGKTFYSYISYETIGYAINNDKDILKKLRIKNPEFVNIIQKLTDRDNPILVSYSFKD